RDSWTSPRRRRSAPRSAAPTAPTPPACSATSTPGAACTAKRWSATARRGPWTPPVPTRAWARRRRSSRCNASMRRGGSPRSCCSSPPRTWRPSLPRRARAPPRATAPALADLLRRTGRARAAIIRLADQLEQDPYDLDALLLLGRALLDDKRTDASVEAFRRVLKFDPEHMGALFHLGVALARVHRYAEAVEAWEKVTRLDPGGPFAQRARMHARTALDLQHIFASDAA